MNERQCFACLSPAKEQLPWARVVDTSEGPLCINCQRSDFDRPLGTISAYGPRGPRWKITVGKWVAFAGDRHPIGERRALDFDKLMEGWRRVGGTRVLDKDGSFAPLSLDPDGNHRPPFEMLYVIKRSLDNKRLYEMEWFVRDELPEGRWLEYSNSRMLT